MSFNDSNRKFCFDRKEFEGEDFSVDEWIQQKRYSLPLGVLRDDLGYFLKCLRSFLIELINQDYGQFVSLSATLVGLDGKIQNIIGPLNKSRNELHILYQDLSSTLSSVEEEVYLLQKIRNRKAQLKHLRLANSSLESSINCIKSLPPILVANQKDSELNYDADVRLVCLTSSEVGATKFFLECCDSVVNLLPTQKLNEVSKELLTRLSSLLEIYSRSGLPMSTSTTEEEKAKIKIGVTSLLHAYSELNAENEAERTFVDRVVRPKCREILAKTGNFTALLDEIEVFMSTCPIIQFNQRSLEFPWVSKFDFVGQGLFPHVLDILTKQFPHIWSPAMPNIFFSNWTRCESFLKVVESTLPSQQHLHRFRQSSEFNDFLSKWQFHVYFHLRFHALAGDLEASLENLETAASLPDPNAEERSPFKFRLLATQVTVQVIEECWNRKKVYISYLSGRFLKASSLFTSRFITAVCDYLNSKKHSLEFLITLYGDLVEAELVIGRILEEKISEASPVAVTQNPTTEFDVSLFLREFPWETTRVAITNRLISTVVDKCLASITSVTEVPRLFRRTNRENPVKPSEYVDEIILPIQSLQNAVDVAKVSEELWKNIVMGAGSQVVTRYHSQIQEVLTSVSRMEESLKRLKKVKGQGQSSSKQVVQGEVKNLSDDDKIRRQIQLDVVHFCKRMSELCPTVDTSVLRQIVEAHTMHF